MGQNITTDGKFGELPLLKSNVRPCTFFRKSRFTSPETIDNGERRVVLYYSALKDPYAEAPLFQMERCPSG